MSDMRSGTNENECILISLGGTPDEMLGKTDSCNLKTRPERFDAGRTATGRDRARAPGRRSRRSRRHRDRRGHAGPANRLLASGAPACLTITIRDRVVLARSAFEHSANYDSIVLLGSFGAVTVPPASSRCWKHPSRRTQARGHTR